MKLDRAILAGRGVVVLWASAFPAIRVAAPDLGVIGLSFVRLAVAVVALLAIAGIRASGYPSGGTWGGSSRPDSSA